MPNPLVQPDPGLFIWTIVTFLVLLWLLAKFAWKPLLALLEKREQNIRNSLKDAEKARVELELLNKITLIAFGAIGPTSLQLPSLEPALVAVPSG